MAKHRRAGKKRKLASSSSRVKRGTEAEIEFLYAGVEVADELHKLQNAAIGDSTTQCTYSKAPVLPDMCPQPKVLAALSSAELSATYGKGFELLQRMGFVDSSHGLRSNSLRAPLQVQHRGKSRVGVHGETEHIPCIVAENKALDSERPMSDLLAEVLQNMEQAGDVEEANELRQLAACVSSEELGAMPECCAPTKLRKDKPDVSGKIDASAFDVKVDGEAMSMLMDKFQRSDFPVDLLGQAKFLCWRKHWQNELGSYEMFIQRHDRYFQIIHCPAPYGPLVMPRHGSSSSQWLHDQRYARWCHDCRLAATGKAKRKWRHVELTISRLCRQKLPSNSESSQLEQRHAEVQQKDLSNTSLREADQESDESVEPLEWCEDVDGCSS